MKRRSIPYILLVAVVMLLSACRTPDSDKAPATDALLVNKEYTAPQFSEPERIRLIADALSEAHQYYVDCARTNHLPGVVYGLVVDDSLVFSGGYGTIDTETMLPVTEQSLFRIASMTKSFTAMAILKLRDEVKLSLSDQASLYIPGLANLEYPTSDAPPITIFNLLTMSAGFPEDNPWGDRFLDITPEVLIEQVNKGIPFSTVPSHHYEYSNLGYGLLGQIVSIVSGIPFQGYISKNLLEPLGMKHTLWEFTLAPDSLLALGYRWENDGWTPQALLHDGAFGAMGGLITSMADFSKYVSLHLSAWPPRSEPEKGPVKRSTLREMHRMNNPTLYSDPERFGNNSNSTMLGYGFGLRVIKDQQGVLEVGHNGGLPGFGSSYMFYPEQGIGIMAFCNLTYGGGPVRSANYKVIESLIDQGLFNPRSLPVSPVLAKRKEQVAELIMQWDPQLEKEIVAANLYLDISREVRMAEARDLLGQCGEIVSVGPVDPENQLRGSFVIEGSQGNVKVYFTLSPEAEPRVQWITLEFIPFEQ
ncbi:MAG: class A beta-lactamase-related serine hydrolase [Bacteroidia bacterium]|nr:MAG: class A beta-lactamase-related serine hydrolase [Bacteroidia bacterium]